ncbi:O-glucosyltransferase rumi homolog [Planococcus citri]|uniref:O-glucosyltransferase rumi homolog n=1 Tax=Planococcus citri TaxID=170843 RepID=UPI0031F843D7
MRTVHYFCFISFLFFIHSTTCSINDENSYIDELKFEEEIHNVWSQFDSNLLDEILKSQQKYNETPVNVQKSFEQIIKKDLKPFNRNKISSKLLKSASSYGTVYQLVNHSLYRSKECMFPSRCEGVEHFLLKLTNLTDFEIVVNTRDYPQSYESFSTALPIFSFSKTTEYVDIMYPAWSFWCGGPAIKLHPTGIGRWDKARKSLIQEMKKWPWEKKITRAFFRGSRTSSERDELILLSREFPNLADAAYTKNQAWKSEKDTLNAQPADEVSFEEHCRFKYLFNFRGVAASFRFKHLFLCKSLVFHVGNEWIEYFYPLMKPWVHYVPIKSDYNRKDIKNILEFFVKHDDLAEKIANNGYQFVRDHLKMSNVTWYWRTLLENYIKLQSYKPSLNHSFKRIS